MSLFEGPDRRDLIDETDWNEAYTERGSVYRKEKGINRLRDTEKQKTLKDSLQKLEDATGLDQSGHIKEVEKCTSDAELNALEAKFKGRATKWYKLQLQKSGLYEPMNDAEVVFLNNELEGLVNWFKTRPLAKPGDLDMITTLSTLPENMQPQKDFRAKLKKQSKFVKDEYFRRIPTLALVGSKQALLSQVLSELKGVEDAPDAVQYEFKKKQTRASANKETATLAKEVLGTYETLHQSYVSAIVRNKDYFGGEDVETPYGKLPVTAKEFIEWFEDQESFADMKDALKRLPDLVQDRKELYEKRDGILKHATPKDKAKFIRITDKMRRHELDEYLDELELSVRNKSLHVAEFTGLSRLNYKGIPLFQEFERSRMVNKFKLVPLESQNRRLEGLYEDIADRERTIQDYLKLPYYLKDDLSFFKANQAKREEMLEEALAEKNAEKDSPFDISNKKELTSEDTQNLSNKLESEDGSELVDNVLEDLEQEGRLKAAEIQKETYFKIFGHGKRAESKFAHREDSQKESYISDLKHWMRLDQNVKTDSDATNNKEKGKLRSIQAAEEAYDKGHVMTVGGEVRKLQKIDAKDLRSGRNTTKIREQLKTAKYAEHLKLEDEVNDGVISPLKLIEELSEDDLKQVAILAIHKLAANEMKLSGSNVTRLKNSPGLFKKMQAKLIKEEFTHLKENT